MDISIKNYNYVLSIYSKDIGTITLGYEFNYAKNMLSDKDFDTFISDSIIHEFLHSLLHKEFDYTICKLYDTIEHFICNISIKEKVFNAIRIDKHDDFPTTWHYCIINEGFDIFLQEYHINNNDLIQAYIIAGGK